MIEVGLKDAATGEIIGAYQFVSCPRVGETLVLREVYMHRYRVEAVEHWPKQLDLDPAIYHAPVSVIADVHSVQHFDV